MGAVRDTARQVRERWIVAAALRRGELLGGWAAARGVRHRLGVSGAGRVLASVLRAKLRGEPFRRLGPPRDRRDRLSRRQCGDLVLLKRALQRPLGERESIAECRRVVLAAASPFLEALVPDAAPQALRSQLPELIERFFNADSEAVVGPDTVGFDVHRCRFVELLQAVGESQLAPLLCEADELVFDGRRRKVVLRRTGTLAAGARRCDFRFEPPP